MYKGSKSSVFSLFVTVLIGIENHVTDHHVRKTALCGLAGFIKGMDCDKFPFRSMTRLSVDLATVFLLNFY